MLHQHEKNKIRPISAARAEATRYRDRHEHTDAYTDNAIDRDTDINTATDGDRDTEHRRRWQGKKRRKN